MKIRLLLFIFFLSCTGGNQEHSEYEKIASAISDSYHCCGSVPLASSMDPSLTISDAYVIQKYFVDSILKNDEIAGYKTGLASKKGQSMYFVESPISGVLFRSGKNEGNSVINTEDYNKMLVETELGFRISDEITEPVINAEELNDKISGILPVVELPDVRFAENQNPKLTDVVAANICSSKFIMGSEHDFNKYGSENIDIELKLNGKKINNVSINDSMDYQKQLLVWLINNQIKNGWKIKTGQILITGAMEKINEGQPGDYEADYGVLGKIKFSVR